MHSVHDAWPCTVLSSYIRAFSLPATSTVPRCRCTYSTYASAQPSNSTASTLVTTLFPHFSNVKHFPCVTHFLRICKKKCKIAFTKCTVAFPLPTWADRFRIAKLFLKALAVASKDFGMEVNADKTKCMVMSRDQNAGRSHNIKIDNRSFESVEQFRYFWTIITNQNSIQEEIKSRLKSGNAYYYSVQNILSSSFLYKILKIKIHRTIILSVVLYGYETWSLTLREERRLRVSENRVLRRIFVSKRDEVTEGWRKLHNEELNDMYSLPNIVRGIKSRKIRWAGHVAGMGVRWGEVHTGVWWGNLRGKNTWKNQAHMRGKY